MKYIQSHHGELNTVTIAQLRLVANISNGIRMRAAYHAYLLSGYNACFVVR